MRILTVLRLSRLSFGFKGRRAVTMASNPGRMREKEEVNHTHKIDNRRGRAHHPARTIPESRENVRDRQFVRSRNTCVMPAKRVQLMSIRCGDKRLVILRGHLNRPSIQVEEPFVKMTELDRVEAIDIIQEPFPDRTAQHIKRMRRDREYRQSAAGAKLPDVIETS